MTDATPIETDILVIGAGPVGMTLARMLQHAGTSLRVLLVDRRQRGSHAGDPRALALSYGTRQLLEPLGAWNLTAGSAIHDIHVSQAGGFGRTLITREEQSVPALGYVMRYRDLAATLDAGLAGDSILDRAEIGAIETDRSGATIRLQRDDRTCTVRAQLVVHAEGTPGDDQAVRVMDYRQHAVLAEVKPSPAHDHRAWERFTADGPLALLPLGEDYSVVFTVPPAKADALMAMDDADFLAALQRQFGNRVHFTAASPRTRYPLALRLRRQLTAPRQAWIGNTAQTLHPVSGQGFNLGIRDARQLADALLRGEYEGKVPADDDLLADYARGRDLDRIGSAAFTDGIVRAFSNDFAPLRLARGLGLLALDLCLPARKFVAGRMIWGARGC